MQVAFKDNHTIFSNTDVHQDRLLKRFGFYRLPIGWITPDPYKVGRVLPKEHGFLIKLKQHANKKFDKSLALYSDIDVPAPEGLQYKAFQKAAIEYMLLQNSNFIADEMGTGKTIEFIGYANKKEFKKILIVCPASLKENWKREFKKWSTMGLTVGVTNGSHLSHADVIIINYDILNRHIKKLNDIKFDCIALDEAHKIKNLKAIRTQCIVGYRGKYPGLKSKYKVAITGTPFLNRPIEVFTLLKWLYPYGWYDQFKFASRFCDAKKTPFGWDFTGHSNMEELQNILRSVCMVRRLKSDVLPQLPSRTRQVIEFEPITGSKRRLKQELSLFPINEEDEFEEVIKKMQSGKMPPIEEIAEVRKQTAMDKLPLVVSHLKELIDSGQKVIVFAWHHEVMDALKEEFKDISVMLTGKTAAHKKDDVVQQFQNDESIRLFIGNIQAAGVGHTLTKANYVCFAEITWTPGDISQAEDRVHRMGLEHKIIIQHLVFKGSIDSIMAKAMVRKSEVFEAGVNTDMKKKEEELFT